MSSDEIVRLKEWHQSFGDRLPTQADVSQWITDDRAQQAQTLEANRMQWALQNGSMTPSPALKWGYNGQLSTGESTAAITPRMIADRLTRRVPEELLTGPVDTTVTPELVEKGYEIASPAMFATTGIGKVGKVGEKWTSSGQVVDKLNTKFYRGTVPGETQRIEEVFSAAKGKTFVARTPENARMYGEKIEEFTALPDAKILYQESPEFWKLIGKRKPPNDAIESLPGRAIDNVNDAIKRAEQSGYDAISFSHDSGIGTVLLNESKFKISKPGLPEAPVGKASIVGEAQEYIRGMAMKRKDGTVVTGKDVGIEARTHYDIWDRLTDAQRKQIVDSEGVVTNKGRYLTRQEAAAEIDKASIARGATPQYEGRVGVDANELINRVVNEAPVGKVGADRGEYRRLIDAKTGEVIGESSKGRPLNEEFSSNVDFYDDAFTKSMNRRIIDEHTHPDMSQASAEDLAMLGWSHVDKVRIKAIDGTLYEYTKPEGFKLTPRHIKDIWNKADEVLNDAGKLSEMSVEEYIAEINKIALKKMDIKFEIIKPRKQPKPGISQGKMTKE